MLAFGQVATAHLLSPTSVAIALGLGGIASPLSAVSVLSLSGNVIGIGTQLAQRMEDQGYGFDFADTRPAGAALAKLVGEAMPSAWESPRAFSVEYRVGALLLLGCAIWNCAPEKVPAVRHDRAETKPHRLGSLMRAVWWAGRWLSRADNRTTAFGMLSGKAYLDVSPELIDRALTGAFTISECGEQRDVDGFVEFFDRAASFSWRSQAKLILYHLAMRY